MKQKYYVSFVRFSRCFGDQPEQCKRCYEQRFGGAGRHPKQTHQNEGVAKMVGKPESQTLLLPTLLFAQAIASSLCRCLDSCESGSSALKCVWKETMCPSTLDCATNPGRWCNKHVIQGFHCTCERGRKPTLWLHQLSETKRMFALI